MYQRQSDGKWVGSANVGWTNGRRVRKVVYGRTQSDVVAKLRQVHTELERGLPPSDGRMTVSLLLDRWLRDVLPGRVSEGTLENYRTIINEHIIPTLGSKTLAKLSPADVQTLLTTKQRERLPRKVHKHGEVIQVAGVGGYSPRTVRLIRGVLVQALGQAERWGIVGRNVAALTDGPKLERREGRTLTPPQAKTLLLAAQGEKLEGAFVLMLSLGLRRGEALGLRWCDVDLDRGLLSVNQAAKRIGAQVVLGDVKTARSRRRVNLPLPAVELLRERHADAVADQAFRPDSLIFAAAAGRPIDPSNFRRAFDRVCARAGLNGWHPHELRHSAASIMLAQGVPLEVVSRVLGHSSIRITADVYGHILDPQREQAAEAMTQALWETTVIQARPPDKLG